MPEKENCKLLQPPRTSDKKKKKKKKRKKATASTTTPENTPNGNPQAESLYPETPPESLLPPKSLGQPQGQQPKLRTTTKKNGEQLADIGHKTKQHTKDSAVLLAATNKTGSGGAQGYVSDLSTRARESLRWEGVLEDPQAEEKRLEHYRANRRQRYIAQREALLKEAQDDFS